MFHLIWDSGWHEWRYFFFNLCSVWEGQSDATARTPAHGIIKRKLGPSLSGRRCSRSSFMHHRSGREIQIGSKWRRIGVVWPPGLSCLFTERKALLLQPREQSNNENIDLERGPYIRSSMELFGLEYKSTDPASIQIRPHQFPRDLSDLPRHRIAVLRPLKQDSLPWDAAIAIP